MATKVKRKVKKVEAPKITDGAAKIVRINDGAARTSPAVKVTKARNRRPQQKRSLTPWLIGAGVVLLIAVPTGINVYRQSQLPGERFGSLGNAHISETAPEPRYNSNPPTSGPHLPYTAGWGSYTEVQPDKLLVHNLEDAGVILWYRAGTPEENQQRVGALEASYDATRYRRVVIAPRENLETAYAMTAWRRLQAFDEINPDKVNAFMEAYEGIDHHPAGGA
ncbi:MAG: hypothetical protein AVDCRST_MAG86-1088 [uncultured Truepera sp.]|uniref:DUF3105 domain-containing protein n=1 Tax=uncultured Truepera sp. TaxID=543023 RepID=A0A6J4V090_9DEIN|nr:MAG: hypothetical protein AVDCRST_MAG86-1088 [uncultured Truepera sp.]